MTTLIETLNRWGEAAIPLAGQMLWQTSLLIIVLLALDLLLRHRIRAGFRYALWMLLLVKLVLPPSLALPTGAGYWIERPVKAEAPVEPPVAEVAVLPPPATEVNHAPDPGIIVDSDFFDHLLAEAMAEAPPAASTIEFPVEPEPAIQLTRPGQLLTAWLAGTLLLLGWMLWRWRWVTRLVRASEPAPADLQALLADPRAENVRRAACPTNSVSPAACRQSGRDRRSARSGEADEAAKTQETAAAPLNSTAPNGALGEPRPTIPVRLTDAAMSPAVCGLFRPVILLPRKLVGKLSREQLGTVLLHELIHLRRRDLWVNCVQTLLQIAAWWHPLLWLANARIRRVREEAVDEAVACALRDDADAYPATLLEVAKLTFTRPLMTLGLVGILESKHALKQRIRRLLELPPLESTRLKWWQWLAVAALALVAVPMAEGQRSQPANTVDTQREEVIDEIAEATTTPVQQTSDSTAPRKPDDGATPGDQLFVEVQSWVQLNAIHLSQTLHNSRLNERLSEVRAIDDPEQLRVAILKTFADEAHAMGLTKLHQDELDLGKRLADLQASDNPDQEAMRAAQESLAALQAASRKAISEIMKGAAVGVQANSNRLVGLMHELEAKQRKLIGSGTDVSSLSNLLAAAQAVFEKVQKEHSATLVRMMVNDLWLRDRAVLEHPFVRRHLEELSLTPPAEFLAMDELYRTARNLRDAISMKLAQEKINEALRYDQNRVDQAEVRAEFQRQLDSAGRGMEQAHEEYRALQEKLGPDPLTRPEQTLGKEEFLRLMPVIQASIRLNQSSNTVQSARDRLAEIDARAKDQGSLSPQSGVGNPAAGAPRQLAAVNTTRPPITMQVRAVKLNRRAWQELTNRVGTQAVSGQAQAFIHPKAGLDDWLAGHAEVETIESGRVTAPERRTSILGAGSTDGDADAASRARIELTTWRDTQATNQVWLQLNAAINWSGPVTMDGGPVPTTTGADATSTGSAGVTFGTNTRGYVNQQLATAGVKLTAGQWAIIGGPAEGQTAGPFFAVVASPQFAQSGSNRDSADGTLGDGTASIAPPPTGTPRRLTGDQIDHIYVLKDRMFFKAADGATAEGLENVSQLLSRDRFVAIMAAPDIAFSDMVRLLDVMRVKRVGSFTVANLTDAQSAALESSSGALNNSATGSPGELPPASEQPDAAKRTYGWLAEQAPEWQQSWGMRQPSPPFKLPHTNFTEYGAQMITSKTLFPDPRVSGYRIIGLEPRFVLVPVEGLTRALGGQLPLARPLIIASNELAALTNSLIEAGAVDHSSASPTRFSKMSGGVLHWQVAQGEPSQVMFQTAANPVTNAAAASPRQIVFGARHSVPAFAPDWVPLTLLARPFTGDDGALHSILSLATGGQQPDLLAQAEETIPPGRSLVWASTNEVRAGFAQAVILHNSGPPAEEADESADGAGEVAVKIQNAKQLIEAGKLDEAEVLLRQAATSSTAPAEVYYHLDRIQQLKLTANPLRNPYAQRPPIVQDSPGRHKIMEKLNGITLDRVGFDNVPLSEVIKELADESRRRDPEEKGINFMIVSRVFNSATAAEFATDPATGAPVEIAPGSVETPDVGSTIVAINPPFSNLRLIDVLNTIVMSADRPIKFTVEEFAVVFTPRTPEPEHLETRVFRLNPNTFEKGKLAAIASSPAPSGAVTNDMSVVNRVVRDHFEAAGVSLQAPKMIYFNERTGLLMVKATLEDFEIIQRAVEKLRLEGKPQASPPAEDANENQPRPEGAPLNQPEGTVNSAAPTDSASALPRGLLVRGTNPEEIRARLNSTIVPQVEFKDTPLPEVLRTLQGFTRTPGPLLDEIRFTFGLYQDGQPRGRWPDGSLIEPEKIRINVTPPLENRSLAEVLTVVAARSSSPLFFTVESIGVVFRPQMVSESLETRVFRVNPNTFNEALKVVMTNALPTTPARTNAPAPAPSVHAPGGGGIRFLTTNDMSAVNLAVRDYFEMVGVKFEPPKMIHFNDRTGMLMVKATQADLEFVQRAVEMLNYEPPQVTLEVRTVEMTEDDVRVLDFDWFMNPMPGQPVTPTNTVTGVLTDPQFRLVIRVLEQRSNVSVEFFRRTTTVSGRQTQFRRSESTNVVTGVTNAVAGPEYRAESVAVGTTVTLSPFVLEDGHTIDLLADVRLVQFLGYDDPGARGLPAHVPLPHFNRQSTRQSMKIRSGDTMVLGGMTTQHLVVAKDKVPVLGDIPLLGRLFHHEEKFMETKHVFVFITPTIIDPAGNRVHSPEQLPFTQEQVPLQPDQE